ncbi:MAG: cyanophycin synthetase, partial [Pseudomonadota bacterium]
SAKNIQALTNGCYSFCLSCGSSSIVVKLNVLGRHNIANALAASACGLAAGIQLEFIAKGLALFAGEPGRLQLVQSQSGCTLIDDTYNANPGSVNAASDVLSALAGEKILVLGDMAELGDEAKHFHQQVGHYARDKGINAVFAIGNHCRETVTAFGDNAHFFSSMDRLIEDLLAVVTPYTAVMVKGSRSSKMERVIQALKSNGDNNNASLAC